MSRPIVSIRGSGWGSHLGLQLCSQPCPPSSVHAAWTDRFSAVSGCLNWWNIQKGEDRALVPNGCPVGPLKAGCVSLLMHPARVRAPPFCFVLTASSPRPSGLRVLEHFRFWLKGHLSGASLHLPQLWKQPLLKLFIRQTVPSVFCLDREKSLRGCWP